MTGKKGEAYVPRKTEISFKTSIHTLDALIVLIRRCWENNFRRLKLKKLWLVTNTVEIKRNSFLKIHCFALLLNSQIVQLFNYATGSCMS